MKRAIRHVTTLAGLSLLLPLAALAPARAQEAPASAPPPASAPAELLTHQVPRAASSIEVDGQLDEAAWAQAAVVPIAYEWTPGDNVTPPVATEGLVTYDDAHLYVAWRAHDPEPAKIRATYKVPDGHEPLTGIAIGYAASVQPGVAMRVE